MPDYTENYKLIKPHEDEYYDVNQFNNNVDIIDTELKSHSNSLVASETGIHGIRYYDDKLEVFDGIQWVEVSIGGGNGNITDDVFNLVISLASENSVTISWNDPDNDYWKGTVIVRKTGDYPLSPTDGTIVVNSQVKNQYAINGFTDKDLATGCTYYYQLFPYSDSYKYNLNETNRKSIEVPYVEPNKVTTKIVGSMASTRRNPVICVNGSNVYITGDTEYKAAALIEKFNINTLSCTTVGNFTALSLDVYSGGSAYGAGLCGHTLEFNDGILYAAVPSPSGGAGHQFVKYIISSNITSVISGVYLNNFVKQHSSVLYGNKIFIFGGNNDSGDVSTIYTFDTSTNTVEQIGTMMYTRSAHTSILVGDKVYHVGGSVKEVECYDIKTNTSKVIGTLTYTSSDKNIVYRNGKLYCLGVYLNRNRLSVQKFDITTGECEIIGKLGTNEVGTEGIYEQATAVINDRIFIFGGREYAGKMVTRSSIVEVVIDD